MKWLAAGYDVSAVRRAIERSARRDGYVPPTSLQFFDEEIRERTQWEAVNGAPDTLGDVLLMLDSDFTSWDFGASYLNTLRAKRPVFFL